MTVVADVCTHTELELERQCLQEQRQQLESRHHELTAAAESLSSQLQVTHDAFVESLFVQSLKWGTGVTGLAKGLATFPQGNEEPLVVKDKIGRPLGELRLSKSLECDTFSSLML